MDKATGVALNQVESAPLAGDEIGHGVTAHASQIGSGDRDGANGGRSKAVP